MAITTPTICGPEQIPIARSAPWALNNDEDDATPAVTLKAAPGSGYALYITHVTISGQTVDVAVTLQDEDATVLFGPIQMQADGGGIFTKDWKYPLKLTDNKSLDVLATNGVAFTIYVEGFTGRTAAISYA
jgi:hypothetical protein